ncbi:two-component system sensor histidine kinase NtrB [Undibacterium flavidum]|uniref:histidine kinase n=1 Tax=Undibacterium flavidum TaxID=2762297 RepID=A0ABR6YGD5_9BURK|nr:PAS domain S-box protein [Undibacterium flavidum]MBC3875582.1 PAS domain S-box protein [Undibacterium flavidum]
MNKSIRIPMSTKRFRTSLPWMLPIVLVLLFLAVLIWLPWQAQRMEANERQEQLIADTLWVEQALQFQLKRNEESLLNLAEDYVDHKITAPTTSDRLRLYTTNNHEIQDALLWDAQHRLVASNSDSNDDSNALKQALIASDSFTQKIQKPSCAKSPEKPDSLICRYPLFRDKLYLASITVSYRLQTLLDETVPWWFAQDNDITLLDSEDKILARRAAGGSGKNVYTHNRTLEFPQLSITLRTNSTKSEPKLLSNLLVLSVILLSLGLVWSLIALWRDINRRLQAEGALRKEAAFRAAMENSLITGLRARDMQGRLTYVNPSFCKMLGFPAEELVGKLPPMPYWAPEEITEYENRFAQILTGTVQPEGFETIYQRANGERFPVLIYESPLVDDHGQQTGWMSSILDVSELKRAQELSRQQEEKLHQNARLATMGEMASMLAHELNQPLAAISSYTTGALNILKQEQAPADLSLLAAALEKATQQAQRAAQVIRSVHEFVKKREASRAWFDINALLQSVMPLIALQAQSAHIHVHYQIDPDLPEVFADKVLIEQVLLNLTRNAIEAMHDVAYPQRQMQIHAHFLFSPSSTPSSTPSANLSSNESTDRQQYPALLLIQVIDQGHGISAEVAEKLFSPFFSTKAAGMGMGLNICRTAIEFHGGSLKYRPNPLGGTVFEFTIPCRDKQSMNNAQNTHEDA